VADLAPALTDALRAPMTSILGYSDLLASGAALSEDQLARYLQRIDANLARMQVMLGNLLTVIELDDIHATTSPDAIDVARAVETALGRARAQISEKSLGVNLDVAGPLPPASADRRALDQIIDNLLVNATLRSPQGGDIHVGVQLREETGGARAIVLSVHDRGQQLRGLPGTVLEIDEGDHDPISLKLVRILANRQGGRAWAEADPHGARFHVRLPIRKAA